MDETGVQFGGAMLPLHATELPFARSEQLFQWAEGALCHAALTCLVTLHPFGCTLLQFGMTIESCAEITGVGGTKAVQPKIISLEVFWRDFDGCASAHRGGESADRRICSVN